MLVQAAEIRLLPCEFDHYPRLSVEGSKLRVMSAAINRSKAIVFIMLGKTVHV